MHCPCKTSRKHLIVTLTALVVAGTALGASAASAAPATPVDHGCPKPSAGAPAQAGSSVRPTALRVAPDRPARATGRAKTPTPATEQPDLEREVWRHQGVG